MLGDAIQTPIVSDTTRIALARALLRWYANTRRDLPWRRSSDPYAIWVSEVMLQQTQVKTVLPYYLRFMQRFPTAAHLARADLASVLKAWEGLGYYSRARNLHQAAQIITARFRGQLPDTWDRLRALPGIGDYIAAAVLSIAFGLPLAVADGNVKRVLARLWCLDAPVNDAAFHRSFQELAGRLLAGQQPGDYNQAMMELGALVCTPRQPICHSCPLASWCCARQQGAVAEFPKRKPRKAIPRHTMVAAVVIKKGRILLVQRPAAGLLGGLWEFPNGLWTPEQDPARVCAEHVSAQLRIAVDVKNRIAVVHHTYTHFKLELSVYHCPWRSGRVRLSGPAGFAWIPRTRLEAYPLHRAVQKALPAVHSVLESEAGSAA
jgi:A/G-specific adenine glycosylase